MSTDSGRGLPPAESDGPSLHTRRAVLVAAAIAGAGAVAVAVSAVATGSTSSPTAGTPAAQFEATPGDRGTPRSALGTPLAAVTVEMRDYKFVPDTLRIAAGTTVTWTNADFAPHSATGKAGEFDSGTVGGGESFSHRFESVGTIPYYCRFHAGSMTGTIEVD